MEFQLLGKAANLDKDVLTVDVSDKGDASLAVSCSGNACKDIDYQFDQDTNSYHFFNDGEKKIQLKVRSASYFGCGGSRSKRMRPFEEWDTGFFGICSYEANYR